MAISEVFFRDEMGQVSQGGGLLRGKSAHRHRPRPFVTQSHRYKGLAQLGFRIEGPNAAESVLQASPVSEAGRMLAL